MDAERQVEEGVVAELDPGPPARVRVVLATGPGCEECGARVFCRPEDAERRSLWVRVEGASPAMGSRVRVAVEGSRVLAAGLWAYGAPLAGFLAGVGLVWPAAGSLPGREGLAFLGGLVGAALPLALLARRTRRRPAEEWLRARLLQDD
jgi:positive regulator of sigma E activity